MSGQREWQPGDVAMGRVGCHAAAPERLIKCEDGDWVRLGVHSRAEDCLVEDARPLVVIDPEDREQVERLAAGAACTRQQMEYALREFANPAPPKPDEPMGLGAVVEDSESVLWTHIGNGRWVNDQERHRSFSNVTAVRILSEGVQP